jgi:hypothetical protein
MCQERTNGSCEGKYPFVYKTTNRLALVFFDSQGVICTNLVTKETVVNVTYFRTALDRLVNLFENKMPNVAARGVSFGTMLVSTLLP